MCLHRQNCPLNIYFCCWMTIRIYQWTKVSRRFSFNSHAWYGKSQQVDKKFSLNAWKDHKTIVFLIDSGKYLGFPSTATLVACEPLHIKFFSWLPISALQADSGHCSILGVHGMLQALRPPPPPPPPTCCSHLLPHPSSMCSPPCLPPSLVLCLPAPSSRQRRGCIAGHWPLATLPIFTCSLLRIKPHPPSPPSFSWPQYPQASILSWSLIIYKYIRFIIYLFYLMSLVTKTVNTHEIATVYRYICYCYKTCVAVAVAVVTPAITSPPST